MSRQDRPAVDAAVVRLLALLRSFVVRAPHLARLSLRTLCAVLAVAAWPISDVRRRARRAGVAVSPLRWGASVGSNLASVLGAPPLLQVEGFPDRPGPAVVLAGHQGPWEAGAAELARRGVRPLVIAAPWPRLPRTAAFVAACRAAHGVRSEPRGRATLAAATRHLRDGGWVVVLVDSLHPRRPGRRATPFVDAEVGAPDGLVAWAARQGAAVLVATAQERTFSLQEVLAPGVPARPSTARVHRVADAVVATLRSRALERPAEWLWVRALATLCLAALASCAPTELPPLPLEPDRWLAEAEGLRWQGSIEDGPAHFEAAVARGRRVDGSFVGGFEGVALRWETDGKEVVIEGRTAFGSVPGGPLTVTGARVHVDGVGGEVAELTWSGGRGITCGGCPLEDLVR